MSRYAPAVRPLTQCLRGGRRVEVAAATTTTTLALRPATTTKTCLFSTTTQRQEETTTTSTTTTTSPDGKPLEGWELDPNRTTLPWAEKELMKKGTPPVGSRRRRAALRSAPAGGVVPFELMPYQCFQEARKVLQADRQEKLSKIQTETAKIEKLEAVLKGELQVTSRGGTAYVQRRLWSLRKHVEHLKILADVNDPQVKRRFEDGLGDMNKPIYRYLAEQRWRGRPLRLLQQRIDQFHLAPDLLSPQQMVPRADVDLFFRTYHVAHGAIVDSLLSEVCPRLRIQVFDRGTRLITVAIVDADVPDLASDAYTTRCHFLAANVPVDPTNASVPLGRLDVASQVVQPWLPAFAQKGSGAHRLAVLVFEQPKPTGESNSEADGAAATPATATPFTAAASQSIDVAAVQQAFPRDGFSVRRFVSQNHLRLLGCTLFRTQWDAGTENVMQRAGVPGADIELKPVRYASLKPPRKARGWEAKHQGPKFRHLWKYTHRIATPKRKFVR